MNHIQLVELKELLEIAIIFYPHRLTTKKLIN